MNSQSLHIHAVAHPFALERIDVALPLGLSIDEIIQAVQPDAVLRRHVHVFINGDYVAPELWARVRPKKEAIVTLRMVPQGGGGKNPLRTILSVALLAATPYLGAMIGGTLATQFGSAFSLSISSKLITGGLNFVGRLALNAIAPPSRSNLGAFRREDQTRFIQGARNAIEPFSSLPQILGRHRIVPPLAAKPYTETVGEEQYIRMLFAWGYGPLDISELKIGETALSEFEHVEIETRTGGTDDLPMSLYSRVVLQNDMQVKLAADKGFEIRTTEEDTDEISVDITFPNGLVYFGSSGGRAARHVAIEVQYAPHGTEDWTAGAESYKAISAQTAGQVEPPGQAGIGSSHNRYKRIDSLVIDALSGNAEIITGEKHHGYNAAGMQVLFPDKILPPPILPENKIEIARIVSLGQEVAFEIIDMRPFAAENGAIENPADFNVTVSGKNVHMGAGKICFSGFDISARQTSALRKTLRFKVPTGQYDVRLRRLTPDSDNDNIFDEVFWTALRSIRNENPVQETGLAMTALRIKATDQLNGTIDEFNGVVASIVPDWDGENWTPRATSNPASLYRHVLTGRGNARPLGLGRIDDIKLQNWHGRCAENEREYNAVTGGGQSVMDVLGDIASAGRASPTMIDGRWGVVEDILQDVSVQHFTPRNSWGFEAERGFEDRPDALRVKFNNREKGWRLDERIVYDDGFSDVTAEKFETLELTGVTDANQAWRDGRYHLASARLRSEIYSFYTDIEHIVCTRGDLVLLTHDVAMAGIASARIKNLVFDENDAVIAIDIDETVTGNTGKNYVARIRTQSGAFLLKPLNMPDGATKRLVFQLSHEGSPLLNEGDICVFGEAGQDSLELIVKSIEPQNDLAAKITCVAAAPELHGVDAGDTPVFESLLSAPLAGEKPETPVIKTLQSGPEVIKTNTDGSFTPQIVLGMKPVSEVGGTNLQVRLRLKNTTEFFTPRFEKTGAHSYAVSDVEEGQFYDVELKYIRANNVSSAPLVLSNYLVEGLSAPPENVAGFSVMVMNDTAHLSWEAVADIDLSHYQVKFCGEDEPYPAWHTGVEIIGMVPKMAVNAAVPALSGTYMIKAVDLGGRESAVPALIHSNIARVSQLNMVEKCMQHPLFAGAKNHVVCCDQHLRLDAVDVMENWENFDDIENIDTGLSGFHMSGSYDFHETVDLGAVYTSRLTSRMKVDGLDLYDTLDRRDNIDLIEYWDSSAPPDKWSVRLKINKTPDDPSDPQAAWSGWQDFMIGDHTARAFKFRLVLDSRAEGYTPVVSMLAVDIDMPDRMVTKQDIESGTDILNLAFDPPFRVRPVIAIAAQGMDPGDYHVISGLDETGFSIRFFDQDHNPASRSFDYLAKGYGNKI